MHVKQTCMRVKETCVCYLYGKKSCVYYLYGKIHMQRVSQLAEAVAEVHIVVDV